MLERGKKVGEYVLLEKIGAGGFGDVWKAEKRTILDANNFALKFFRPKDDHIDFDKIGRELAVWKRLKGLPHIISVIELDRFEDYVYVVSDFADGGSLEKHLKKTGGKAASEAEAVKITSQILAGLENLHEKGFVHRDLKPDNILIMNGKYCLADFGISREMKTHSRATGAAGTVEYMPPEAFEKSPFITQQTDIWAVGVILQKLLTGGLPYPQDNQPALIAAILMGEPEPIPETVSKYLRDVVGRALQKERGERFETAREMRDTLKYYEKLLAGSEKKTVFYKTPVTDIEKTEELKIKPTEDWQEIEKKEREALKKAEAAGLTNLRTTQRSTGESRLSGQTDAVIDVTHDDDDSDKSSVLNGILKRERNIKWIALGSFFGIFLLIFGGIVMYKTVTGLLKYASRISGLNQTVVKNTIGMEFVEIPAGSFLMGSEDAADEKPVHKVSLTNSFYMGKHEVTQEQWLAIMGYNPSSYKNCSNCPVENVSWGDIQEFIKRLNKKEGEKYRLPTEAEWEYACRAGTTGAYSGDNIEELGWFEKNSGGKTHSVGEKKANAFGLHDMHGNVWEWTADWYGNYTNTDSTNPTGVSTGTFKVIRGGSWGISDSGLRSSTRSNRPPALSFNFLGFRLVKE